MGGIVQRSRKCKDPYEGFEVFRKYKFSGIKLGVGETCQVHEAYNIHSSGEEMFAVKIIVKDEVELAGRALADLYREVEIMGRIRNPNICRLYEMFEDNDLMFFVLEYCEGGTLFEKLEQDAVLEEPVAKPMVKEMFTAVTYLHEKGYIHRDLRPENWMLSDLSDEAKVKLSHFRLSMECGKDQILSQPCGTLHYVAPEVLRGSYGRQSDVWTLGVLIFLMLYGSYPFDGDSSAIVMTCILASEADWSDSCYALSADAKDLLKRLLCKTPATRITFTEALKHPWMPPRGSKERPSIGSMMTGLTNSIRSSTLSRSFSGLSGGHTLHTLSAASAHRPILSAPSSAHMLKGSNGQRRISALVTNDLLKSAGALQRAQTDSLEELARDLKLKLAAAGQDPSSEASSRVASRRTSAPVSVS